MSLAVYIHIPFCDHKCIYCDFYSIINYQNLNEYLKCLKAEIKYYADQFLQNRIIDTIFFGGGTPSLMEPKYLEEILQQLYANFNVSKNVEITMETNPGTVSKQKLEEFKAIGINRISIGVQTFDEKELKFLTRIHDKKIAIKTVENAKDSGFENISIDLIFSLPKQSRKTWLNNLEIAVSLPIKHISAYSLILERGTILNKMVLDGKVRMTDEKHDADLYKLTMDYLENKNFNQYEISNFAKVGYECKHNLYYWEYKDYLGFGTAAHSFVNGKRWWNYSSLKQYIDEVKTKKNAVRGKETLTNSEMLKESIMLSLRSKGLNLKNVTNYSQDWYFKKEKIINSFKEKKYLQEKNGLLSCTKKGYLLCDEIIQNLI